MSNRADELQIRQYLLGELTEQEQQWIDQRILTDAEFYRRVALVEDDLTDEYAARLMSQEERKGFERRFLPVPRRQLRLKLAGMLTERAAKPTLNVVPTVEPGRRAWPTKIGYAPGRDKWALVAGLTAILLLGCAVVWLSSEVSNLKGQVEDARAALTRDNQREDLQKEITKLQDEVRALISRLDSEQTSRQALEQMVAGLKDSTTDDQPTPKQAVATFLLAPGMLRDAGQPTTIDLAAGVNQVRLVLKIENPSYRFYRAALRSDEGAVVWQQAHLKRRQEKEGQSVYLSVPAKSLKRGDYTVRLEGAGYDRIYNRVGTYYLRVDSK